MRRSKKEKGFTMIELVIVAGIATFVLIGAIGLYVTLQRNISQARINIDVASSARQGMSEIAKYIRQASFVDNDITYNGRTYTTGSTTLVLAIPGIDSSGVPLTNVNDYVLTRFATSTIIINIIRTSPSVRGMATRTIATGSIANLTFSYDSPVATLSESVDVSLTSAQVYRAATTSQTVHERIYIRN